MAQPEPKPSTPVATVASCAATDCQHNDERTCTATHIEVSLQDGRATCATYAPEHPKTRP
jgi:hypothetical protein